MSLSSYVLKRILKHASAQCTSVFQTMRCCSKSLYEISNKYKARNGKVLSANNLKKFIVRNRSPYNVYVSLCPIECGQLYVAKIALQTRKTISIPVHLPSTMLGTRIVIKARWQDDDDQRISSVTFQRLGPETTRVEIRRDRNTWRLALNILPTQNQLEYVKISKRHDRL